MEENRLSKTNPAPSRFPIDLQSARQIMASFLHLKKPNEAAFVKALYVASSTSDSVCSFLEHLKKEYPWIQFQVLTDERNRDALFENFPGENIRVYPLAIKKQEKFNLIASLWQEQYDVCFVLSAGDFYYGFIKAVGLLSGAKYIKTYYEPGSSFYVMVSQPWKLIKHLVVLILNGPIDINYRSSIVGTLIGYFVVLTRVLPMLRTAKRMKDLPNPFLEK